MSSIQLSSRWPSKKLSELSEFVLGGDWGKAIDKAPDDYIKTYVIRGSEFKNWKNDFGSTASFRAAKPSSVAKRNLQEGDILIEISGGGPEQPVGRTVLIDQKVLQNFGSKPVIATNFLRLFRSVADVESDYLNLYLTFFYHSGEVVKYQAGSNNLRNLKFKNYIGIDIPLPPLPEQRAIVAKLEDLFETLDRSVAELEQGRQRLGVYRQAVLKEAFAGNLTADWREQQWDLPLAEASIERILFSDKDLPYLLPKSWIWTNLGNVVKLINGDRGKNYPNRSEYKKSGIPWINTGHIMPDGSLSLEKMNYLTREKYDSLRSGKVQINDLVYCLRGATFGKTAVISSFNEGAIASSLVIIRPSTNVKSKLLYYFLTSVGGKVQLRRFDNGSAQPNLSAKSVKAYHFPLPSITEQHQIVAEIESRLSVAEALERSIDESLERAKALRQSLLKRAFSGELLEAGELAGLGVAVDKNDAG